MKSSTQRMTPEGSCRPVARYLRIRACLAVMTVQLLDRGSKKISTWNNFGSAKILLHGNLDGKFAANLRLLKMPIRTPAEITYRMRQLMHEMILFRYCLIGTVMTRFRRHNAGRDHAPLR